MSVTTTVTDFMAHTLSEACVQCVCHSDPWHTADSVFIHRCCDHWSNVELCM